MDSGDYTPWKLRDPHLRLQTLSRSCAPSLARRELRASNLEGGAKAHIHAKNTYYQLYAPFSSELALSRYKCNLGGVKMTDKDSKASIVGLRAFYTRKTP